jgi:hypothetical protein
MRKLKTKGGGWREDGEGERRWRKVEEGRGRRRKVEVGRGIGGKEGG